MSRAQVNGLELAVARLGSGWVARRHSSRQHTTEDRTTSEGVKVLCAHLSQSFLPCSPSSLRALFLSAPPVLNLWPAGQPHRRNRRGTDGPLGTKERERRAGGAAQGEGRGERTNGRRCNNRQLARPSSCPLLFRYSFFRSLVPAMDAHDAVCCIACALEKHVSGVHARASAAASTTVHTQSLL
jgi:hypothetical protein